MNEKYISILSLRASGYVTRWHTIQTLGNDQSDAEHSAQALVLLFGLHPDPSVQLIKALLYHDLAEREVGDVPAPVRRANKAFSDAYEEAENDFFTRHGMASLIESLTETEFRWLKAIDCLELWLYCRDQVFLGNGHFSIIQDRAYQYLMGSGSNSPGEVRAFVYNIEQIPYRSFA